MNFTRFRLRIVSRLRGILWATTLPTHENTDYLLTHIFINIEDLDKRTVLTRN
jgi:hypothetical protein